MLNTATVPITVGEGGTGVNSFTTYVPICGGTTSTGILQSVASIGTTQQILTSNGAGALPTFQTKNAVLVGTTTNDSAAAGNIGEWIFSELAVGSAIFLTSTFPSNITSISLTAGDWDVYGNIILVSNTTTSITNLNGFISKVSATTPASDADHTQPIIGISQSANVPGATTWAIPITPGTQSLSGTTTIYLVAYGIFTVSTLKAYGWIGASRRR